MPWPSRCCGASCRFIWATRPSSPPKALACGVALGVELDSDGVPKVDRRTMQAGGLPVFLVGDANGESAVLHEASDDGHIAGLNATAISFECFQPRTPLTIVFSEPNIAMVGKSL